MSATYGPCPRCGVNTMYDDREPTPCPKCRTTAADERRNELWIRGTVVGPEGNRKQRRAAAKLARKK